MIPEIGLLIQHFSGMPWDKDTQSAFMGVLRDEQFFNGEGAKDPALSARDRINRAPKSLGFVILGKHIALTPAGETLLTSRRTDEVFLRQMLKFQIPSPYHKPTERAATFCVKPYLEILRLIRTMGTLKFDELQMFGMQLTDWHSFDEIVLKIEQFRIEKVNHTGSYNRFRSEYLNKELKHIFEDRIERGELKTRESREASLKKFLETQANNMRDYADACFRYLRATGLVSVSHVGKSLSIVPERIEDVDYILQTVDRNPEDFDNESEYVEYLGSANIPQLLTDDKSRLVAKLHNEFPSVNIEQEADITTLKDLLADLTEQRKSDSISKQVRDIKDYKFFDDIQTTFDQIERKNVYDAPLMLEWNTWRAMTMLDGGNIKANLNFDDFGKPMSTAQGNLADIVCDYGEYMLTVEVTMAGGQKQYEMEGEPISRHLGKLKTSCNKPCYGLFIAPTINEACIAHFYLLHKANISYYGGKSVIVPLPLSIFKKMLDDSYAADYVPDPSHVRRFFESSEELANTCDSEVDWYSKITERALHWLN